MSLSRIRQIRDLLHVYEVNEHLRHNWELVSVTTTQEEEIIRPLYIVGWANQDADPIDPPSYTKKIAERQASMDQLSTEPKPGEW